MRFRHSWKPNDHGLIQCSRCGLVRAVRRSGVRYWADATAYVQRDLTRSWPHSHIPACKEVVREQQG